MHDHILKRLHRPWTALGVCQRLALNKDVDALRWPRPPTKGVHTAISSSAAYSHIHGKGPEQRHYGFFVFRSSRHVAGEGRQRARDCDLH